MGVVVTDTAGRAWREGQTDIAIGAAGLLVARGLRRPHRRARQPAGRDRAGRRRRDRRRRPSSPRASSADARSPSSAAAPTWCCRPATTVPAPGRWSGPRAPTCSGTAPARPSSAPCGATRPTGPRSERRRGRRARGHGPHRARRAIEVAPAPGAWRSRCRPRAPRPLAALAFAHGWGPTPRHGPGRPPVGPVCDRRLRRLCPRHPPTVRPPTHRNRGIRPVAKKPAKTDRQAVIDQIRKKQKGADRRRGFMIVGVCTVIALLIVGAAAFQPIKDWWDVRQFNDQTSRRSAPPPRRARRSRRRRRRQPAARARRHADRVHRRPACVRRALRPLPGPDGAQALHRRGPAGARPLVHNLEHGYTILWYDETDRRRRRSDERAPRRSPTSSPAPRTCATSSRPCRGRPTTRAARSSPTASTSRSRTGRPAAPASTDPASRWASGSTAPTSPARR